MFGWIKKNKLKSICLLILLSFILPILIIHTLFKIPAVIPFFIAEWSAGDLINYFLIFISFLGTLTLGALALYQNKNLSEINKNLLEHQFKPIISIGYFIDEQKESFRSYYRIVGTNDKGIMINSGWSKRSINNPDAILSFQNIGLGPAVKVELFWYRLDKVKGIDNLNDIIDKDIDNFYDNVEYSCFTFLDNENIKTEPWLLFTEFDLGNSVETNRLNLLFSFDETIDNLHTIIEMRFEDLMGNKIKKMLYLGYINKPIVLPVSKDYLLKQ
jgi:hypothetical protein